jgi:hypothetical protein
LNSWKEKGIELSKKNNGLQFEIADWILEGIEQYGAAAAYDAAEELFPAYNRATFHVWASVARAFPALTRVKDFPDLKFAHFRAALEASPSVPPLSPSPTEDQKARYAANLAERRADWLRQAQERGLSAAALRMAIYNDLPEPEPEPDNKDEPEGGPKSKQKVAPKSKPKSWLGYSFSLPIDRTQKSALAALATIRRRSEESIVALAVAEYLEANSDEIAGGDTILAKRRAEEAVAEAARDAIEKAKLERRNEYNRQRKRRQELYEEVDKLYRLDTEKTYLEPLKELSRVLKTDEGDLLELESRIAELSSLIQTTISEPDPKTIPPPPVPTETESADELPSDVEYRAFVDRASKVMKTITPVVADAKVAGALMKTYILAQGGVQDLKKVSKANFASILESLEAATPEVAVQLMEGGQAVSHP